MSNFKKSRLFDSDVAGVMTALEAVKAEVAALRAQIEEVLATKPAEVAAESVEGQKDRLAHIEKPTPKVGDLFRVLRDGRTEAKGCWFGYGAGTIVELTELRPRGAENDSAIFKQVGGTPNQSSDYKQIIWFVDLEPYTAHTFGPVPATEISQDAARQMLAVLRNHHDRMTSRYLSPEAAWDLSNLTPHEIDIWRETIKAIAAAEGRE